MTSPAKLKPNQSASALYLTVIEAARYLRISPKTLERMRVEGTGPSFFKVGPGKKARVLYRQTDIDAWLAQFTYASTSEYEP